MVERVTGDPVRIVSSEQWQDMLTDLETLDASITALNETLQSSLPGSPGANLDSFGRGRVSMPYTLFDSQLTLSPGTLFWDTIDVGSGSGLHIPGSAWYRLRVANSINTVKDVGYGDGLNGIFFEQDKDGIWMVRRSNVSGVVVDERVPQSNWSIDHMDGSGPSGVNINPARVQIFTLDLEWLGAGGARTGFMVGSKIWYAHEFEHANILSTVYMATANLPVRFEIKDSVSGDRFVRQTKRYIRYQPRKSQQATFTFLMGAFDTGPSDADLYQICSAVESEGGVQENNLIFGTPPNLPSRTVTNTILPLLSIHLDDKFPAGGSLVNRETVFPFEFYIFSEDAIVAYWFVLNGTLAGESWQAVDTTHSGVEYDVSATTITGGVRIGPSGVAVATPQAKSVRQEEFSGDLALTLNAAGTIGDVLTLCAVRLTNTSSDCWAGITWKELY